MKLIPIGEKGTRIGEAHGRAKLSDHDIELILGLLDARDQLIAAYGQYTSLKGGEIRALLAKSQLSYAGIAEKFEISKSQVRWIALGLQRQQVAARWKRVADSSAQTAPAAS